MMRNNVKKISRMIKCIYKLWNRRYDNQNLLGNRL